MRAVVAVGRLVRALIAIVLLDALVIALPVLLWRIFDWPWAGATLPHALPSAAQVWSALNQNSFPDAALIRGPLVVVWLCWLDMSYGVILHALAALRDADVSSRLARPMEWAARPLVGAVVVALASMTTRFTAMDSGGAGSSASMRTAAHVAAPHLAAENGHLPPPSSPSVTGPVHVVRSGETMWGIAEHDLGSGPRYHEIFALNQGHRQPDGREVADPHWIYPGWRLAEPGPANPGPGHAGPPAAPAPLPAPAAPTATPAIGPATAPSPPVLSTPSAPAGGRQNGSAPAPPRALSSASSTPAAPDDPSGGRGGAPYRVQAGSRPFIDVPGVGIVGLGFAAAIAAAVVRSRRHAWRRWRPGDGGASLRAVDALVSEPVQTLDRLHRRSQLTLLDDDVTGANDSASPPEVDGPATHETHTASNGHAGAGEEAPEALAEPTCPPAAPTDLIPGWIVAAELAGREVAVDIGALSGAGLEGPGALAAARAVSLIFLTDTDVEQVEMLVVGDAIGFLPGLERVPGVEVVPNLGAALDRLEREARHREHILGEQEVDDFTALATSVPWEPAVALLVVGQGEAGVEGPRLRAAVERGRRLGIGLLWLGPSPVGASLRVAKTGRVSAAAGADATLAALAGGRLPVLTPDAATALVDIVATGRGAEPEPRAVTDAVGPADTPASPTPLADAGDVAALIGEVAASARAPRTRINVLGPLRIWSEGKPVMLRRTLARELLALLALNPLGVTLDEAITSLFPDSDWERAHQRFRQELLHARKALRQGGDGEHIIHADGRYTLDSTLVATDLSEFEAAQRELRAVPSSAPARIEALERCAAAYGGELLHGESGNWVGEPSTITLREDLRRRASQVLDELTKVRQAKGDLTGAVAAVEQALLIAPDAENLHRQMMCLQAELGCSEGVRGVLRVVEARCSDLGVEPERETVDLAHRLLAEAAEASRR